METKWNCGNFKYLKVESRTFGVKPSGTLQNISAHARLTVRCRYRRKLYVGLDASYLIVLVNTVDLSLDEREMERASPTAESLITVNIHSGTVMRA